MARVSVSEYARSRRERGLPGGSRWGVQKALQAGRITKDPDGLIDADRADRSWDANTAEQKRHEPVTASYQEARAIREALNARLARLDYEERLKELVRVEDVRREAFVAGRALRDRLLAIPGRVAASMVAAETVREAEAILRRELLRALEGTE